MISVTEDDMEKLIAKYEDMDNLTGEWEVIESGEILDVADIRFGYDGQALTLRKVR
jgi:hypothetical protein